MNLRRFYTIAQIEYCRNLIFNRHCPIHKLFERSCELGLWRMTAHRCSEIFGTRLNKKLKGKLHTTIEHGHHTFRAYWKHGFVKQYEKFSTFLRNEICSVRQRWARAGTRVLGYSPSRRASHSHSPFAGRSLFPDSPRTGPACIRALFLQGSPGLPHAPSRPITRRTLLQNS